MFRIRINAIGSTSIHNGVHAIIMDRSIRKFIIALAILAGLCAALFASLLTYREVSSPDGEFVATAKTAIFRTLIPAMPGQAGDKPGLISVGHRNGRSCGATPVEMASMIADLRWELDRKPREALLVATARWDLDACRVEVFPR